jgi:sugar lactone lactonase YvrE
MDVAFDSDGNYYIADSPANRIRRVGSDGIIRTAANVNQPQSLASDGRGGLIIASGGATAAPLRRLNTTTGAISTIDNARGRYVAVDNSGSVFFVNGSQTFRLDARTSEISLVAGKGGPSGFGGDDGPARDASFSNPQRLSIGPSGALYIADSGNDRIRRVTQEGRVTTIAGSGRILSEGAPAEQAAIYDSQGIAPDSRGNIFFTDFLHAAIRKVDERLTVRTVAGNRRSNDLRDDIHPLDAGIGTPSKIVFDRHGNLVVLDQSGSVGVVRVISPGADGIIDGSADERIKTVAGQYRPREEADRGRADGGSARKAVFDAARAVAVDSQDRLFVADVFDHRIRMIVPGSDGVLKGGSDEIITTIAGNGVAVSSGDWGPATAASLFFPGGYGGLTIDSKDNVYVIENSARVRRIDRGTGIIQTMRTDSSRIWSLVFDHRIVAYLAQATKIRRFDVGEGTLEDVAGGDEDGFSGDGGPATQALMAGAQFLAVDSRGDVYFPDNGNFRIRRLRRVRQ